MPPVFFLHGFSYSFNFSHIARIKRQVSQAFPHRRVMTPTGVTTARKAPTTAPSSILAGRHRSLDDDDEDSKCQSPPRRHKGGEQPGFCKSIVHRLLVASILASVPKKGLELRGSSSSTILTRAKKKGRSS